MKPEYIKTGGGVNRIRVLKTALTKAGGNALTEEELLEVLQRAAPDKEATVSTVRTYAAVLEATGDAILTPAGWKCTSGLQ